MNEQVVGAAALERADGSSAYRVELCKVPKLRKLFGFSVKRFQKNSFS